MTIIIILFSIWFIASLIYNYLDSKKDGLKWNLSEKYRNPTFIIPLFLFSISTFRFSKTIFYNLKYNPTDLIYSRNTERKNLNLYPITDKMISEKNIPTNLMRYFNDGLDYRRIIFKNSDSIKSKLYYKYISIEKGKLLLEYDIYKLKERTLVLTYNYFAKTYGYSYYVEKEVNIEMPQTMTFYGHLTNSLEDEQISKQEFNDTLDKWATLN